MHVEIKDTHTAILISKLATCIRMNHVRLSSSTPYSISESILHSAIPVLCFRLTPSRLIHYVIWIWMCVYSIHSIIVWTHPNEHKTIYPLFRCATNALILIIIAVQTNSSGYITYTHSIALWAVVLAIFYLHSHIKYQMKYERKVRPTKTTMKERKHRGRKTSSQSLLRVVF